ncbi:MAG: ABC transporter substrate-binding protein [Oscillospiraceae bacterium]|nr:ABC transporter substrate-binding protein [Oscillospiraceae bacterium]
MAKLNKKLILPCLCAAICLSIFSGCEKSGDAEETPLPEASDTQVQKQDYNKADNVFSLNCNKEYSFNPFTTTNASNILCTQLMYDSLFTIDDTFSVTPNLIKSYKSDDGKAWYFYVDTSVKFWDGTTLTATDAAYSVQRAMRSPQFKARLDTIMGVSAMDDSLFIINLYNPDMQFPTLLDIPVIKYGTIEDYAPMGTGPYMPDEEYTKLTAFADHKNAASLPVDTVYLKEIKETEEIITAFEDSEIDLVTNDPTGFFNIGYGSANEIRNFPTSNMHYLGFNSSSRFFSSTLCRKAMTYVVNREQIVSDYMGGAASSATLPMNPTCALYNDSFSDIISYSVSKSENAFEAAEVQDYDDDGLREIMITGIPVEISIDFIVCSDSPAKVQAAQSIADNLTKMGITVNLRQLSWDAYVAALSAGEFDIYYAEVKLSNDFSLIKLLFTDGSLNYGKFSDAVLEQYVNDYMLCGEEGRQKSVDLMFKYITDTAPIVTVCFEKQQVITHRGVITGMNPTKDNVFSGIEDWEINTD